MMALLTPETKSLETQAQRNRVWITWIKGLISGILVASTIWGTLVKVIADMVT